MKKKILFFLTSLNYGGTEKIIITYLNELAKSDQYDLILCVMFPMDKVDTLENTLYHSIKLIYLADLNIGNQFYKNYSAFQKGYLSKINYAVFRLKYNRILKRNFNQVIIENQPTTLIQGDTGMPDYLSKYKYLNKIIFVHFSLDHLFSNFFKKLRTSIWTKKLENYNFVIAIADAMYKQLQPYCCENQLLLNYNPIEVDKISLMSMQEPSLPKEVFKNGYIVSVGRLDENQKDFTGLINALSIIKEKYNLILKLLIVGDGRDRESLKQLVCQKGMENQIYFLGNQRNPYPYIVNSNLFVLSTKFEGLPTVLLEALFLDKLIISSNCYTGPSEILNHDKLLVPVGDDESLADAIHRLLLNEQLKIEMHIHLNKQKVIFNPKVSITKLESLLC